MDDLADAEKMREWARWCFNKAKETKDKENQIRLHKMAIALFEVAESRDWLEGRLSDPKMQAAE